jgi:hypothetical protein
MLFVLCGAVSGGSCLGFTHIRATLCLAVFTTAGKVINLRFVVHPNDSTAEAGPLCFTFAREVVGAGGRPCSLHRRWCGRSLTSDRRACRGRRRHRDGSRCWSCLHRRRSSGTSGRRCSASSARSDEVFLFLPGRLDRSLLRGVFGVALSDRFRGGRKRGHEHQKGEGLAPAMQAVDVRMIVIPFLVRRGSA